MKKSIILLLGILFFLLYSNAQEKKPVRLNFKFTYLVGFQFFDTKPFKTKLETTLLRNLYYKGFIERGAIIPPQWHSFIVSSTIFKNKKWYLSLEFDYGSMRGNYIGYTADKNNNPYTATATSIAYYYAVGYGFSREISIKNWGTIIPKINFFLNGFFEDSYNTVSYSSMDKNTGNVISGYYNLPGVGYDISRNGILMLFDSPRIGVDYNIKINKHLSVLMSYSYWLAASMINSFYGISKTYLIHPNGMHPLNKPTTRYYSHNLSIGVSYKLFK